MPVMTLLCHCVLWYYHILHRCDNTTKHTLCLFLKICEFCKREWNKLSNDTKAVQTLNCYFWRYEKKIVYISYSFLYISWAIIYILYYIILYLYFMSSISQNIQHKIPFVVMRHKYNLCTALPDRNKIGISKSVWKKCIRCKKGTNKKKQWITNLYFVWNMLPRHIL